MAPFGIRRVVGAAVAIVVGSGVSARAAECPVDHGQLAQALRASVKASGGPSNGGFENHEWASVVARDGTVCAVAFSGTGRQINGLEAGRFRWKRRLPRTP